MMASANSTTPGYRILAPWQFLSKAVLLGLFTGGGLGGSIGPGVGVAGGILVTTAVYCGLLFLASRHCGTTSTTTRRSTDTAVAADGGQSNRRD